MPAGRDTTPLIHLAAIAIAPALVAGMLGSLVLFVIEVVYRGDYSARLIYTFFFYVIGVVLIARIAITIGQTTARLYAAGLGAACFLAMLKFVEYPAGVMQAVGPLMNIVLMVGVYFAAAKLTWDCTHFDPARTASGRGVLAAAGIERDVENEDDDDELDAKPRRNLSWLERWTAYREARAKRPHTPGVWIVYFALAALPLFALGQSLVPADDAPRRRATLLYMAIYIASALGLLVTTSLMGLRRYIEDRGARVPAALTFGWLGLGAGLILVFLAIGAVLPRPYSETPLVDLGRDQKAKQSASQNAAVRDSSAGKGDGAEGKKQEAGGQKQGNKGEPKSGQGHKSSGGDGKSQQSKGEQSKGDQSKGDQSKGELSDSSRREKTDSKSQQSERDNQRAEKKQQDSPADKQQSSANDQSKSADQSNPSERTSERGSSLSQLSRALDSISGIVRWVVWIILALAVIAGIVYFCLRGLAPFTEWARNLLDWLRGLFGRRTDTSSPGSGAAPSHAIRQVPFSAFSNPFTDGSAARRSFPELAGYTFAAFEAWAAERGLNRPEGETPREFAARVGNQLAEVDQQAFTVAEVYVRALYGRASPVPTDTTALKQLWQTLGQTRPNEI